MIAIPPYRDLIMIPHHVALLAPALRPALLAAHKALQPGITASPEVAVTILDILQQLRGANKSLTAALRDIEQVVDNPMTTDAEVFAVGANVESRMNGLISAYRACQSLRLGEEAAGRELAEIGRDSLVTYAHFLADLIFATADPAAAIQESNAVQTGDTRFVFNLTCNTSLPDSLDELSQWVAGRFTYDDARGRHVLRLAEMPLVYRSIEPDLPPAPPPPDKAISFWQILGWGALLSLLFGHDHCDCDD